MNATAASLFSNRVIPTTTFPASPHPQSAPPRTRTPRGLRVSSRRQWVHHLASSITGLYSPSVSFGTRSSRMRSCSGANLPSQYASVRRRNEPCNARMPSNVCGVSGVSLNVGVSRIRCVCPHCGQVTQCALAATPSISSSRNSPAPRNLVPTSMPSAPGAACASFPRSHSPAVYTELQNLATHLRRGLTNRAAACR